MASMIFFWSPVPSVTKSGYLSLDQLSWYVEATFERNEAKRFTSTVQG